MKNAIPSALYVFESATGEIKIGRSQDAAKRLKALNAGAGKPATLVYETTIRDDASFIEATAHRLLAHKRKHGEWFDVSRTEAMGAVADAIYEVERRKAEGRGPYRAPSQPSGTTQTITHIRIPTRIYRRIEEMAAKEGRSRNNMIAVLLADAVAEREAQRK